jgi:hypothetical protein
MEPVSAFEVIKANFLAVVVAILSGGGLTAIAWWIRDKLAQPSLDRISEYLDKNPSKRAVMDKLFNTLDPILPVLQATKGNSKALGVTRIVTEAYMDNTVHADAVDGMVSLFSQAFDPFRQKTQPTRLSIAVQKVLDAKEHVTAEDIRSATQGL